MSESNHLTSAREHLAQAEAEYDTADGLHHLQEGLALLEDVALEAPSAQETIARNLRRTYSTKICDAIRTRVDASPALPEPELEHLFKVLVAFDSEEFELPDYVRALKIDVVKRLIDHYYEGHPEETKQQALAQLAGIAGDY